MHGSFHRSGFAALALTLPASWALAVTPVPLAADNDATLTGEPQVLNQVTEDEQVRISELRVRGQTRRLSVQPKVKGLGPYEITPAEPGRPPAQDPKAGQRIWLSLTF